MDSLLIIGIILLGPIIGSFMGILKRPSERTMFNMLSFAAGIMLSISFLELIPESVKFSSVFLAAIGIAMGFLAMFLIDRIVPHIHPGLCRSEPGHEMKGTVFYIMIGMLLHNFPEGIAIGAGSVSSLYLSFAIALAITIHDIPESICTSAPYYYITKKRLKSFLVSVGIALPTILGYLFAVFFFPLISREMLGVLIGITAGLMIYVCSDELIPVSCRRGDHATMVSFMLGILVVMMIGAI